MYVNTILALAFFVVFSAPAKAEDSIDCSKAKYTSEFNYCSEQAFKAADDKLNSTYKKVLSELAVGDKQALVNIQREWLKLRDAQCDLETKETKKGSIWYEVNTKCKTRLTLNRVVDLESVLTYR